MSRPRDRPRLDLQRIRVNKQGYDSSGAYWGAGPDVFIATTPEGSEDVTVRARNMAEARTKVAAELARKPGDARSGQPDPIGGNSPHKSRYDIAWRNPVTNESIRIRITHARDYLASGSDHIEVESIKPKRAPLPITETGYRSHFMPALDLINAGGPVTFVASWLEREAVSKAWTKAEAVRSQGDLFQWAATQDEVGKRRRSPKPKVPAGKPSRRRSRGRDPA